MVVRLYTKLTHDSCIQHNFFAQPENDFHFEFVSSNSPGLVPIHFVFAHEFACDTFLTVRNFWYSVENRKHFKDKLSK